jgi:ketosteroid isomerase-like protein
MASGPAAYVADYLAIRELTARYNRAYDEPDEDAWVATFCDDGIFESTGKRFIQGADELRAYFRVAPHAVIHMTSDALIEVDGDRARQRCTVVAFRRDGDTVVIHAVGTYDDQVRRTSQGWRFLHRVATT